VYLPSHSAGKYTQRCSGYPPRPNPPRNPLDNSKKRGARAGGYALPVGNGEAGAVGEAEGTGAAGAEDAVGVAIGAVGPVGLADADGTGVAEPGAHPLALAGAGAAAVALGIGTGVAAAVFLLVGTATGLALALAVALAIGTGVAQGGVVGAADALAVGATGAAEGLADLPAWAASVPAVAADVQPASSATPVTVPSAQAAVTRFLRVVTFICSSS
jgi:hypothetical protein